QTAPDLTGYNLLPGSITIFGTFTSQPNTSYRLEFFSSPTANQGKTFLAATFVFTDATGFYALSEFLPITISAAEPILTATATDPNFNTSEFGVEVVLSPEILDFRIGKNEEQSPSLFWEIEEVEETLFFEIEQKKADDDFEKIGESWEFFSFSGKRNYQFPLGFLSPDNYQFRLKKISVNGAYSYSNILSYRSNWTSPLFVQFENPVAPESFINLSIQESQQLDIQLFNLEGKDVLHLYQGNVREGELFKLSLAPLSGLPSGMYIMKLKGQSFQEERKIWVR
ncbi:MAG: T9SS type A sorting domain-containing protein, partial [Bacteroidota bacterium]